MIKPMLPSKTNRVAQTLASSFIYLSKDELDGLTAKLNASKTVRKWNGARAGSKAIPRFGIGHVVCETRQHTYPGPGGAMDWERLCVDLLHQPNTSKFSTAMPCIAEISTSPRCGVYTLDSLVYFLY